MSQQIDLSKPVYCGGVHEKYIIILTLKTDILVTRTTFDFREWGLDGTPLGDWPPLTNTPPVKPSVDESGEEVKVEGITLYPKGYKWKEFKQITPEGV